MRNVEKDRGNFKTRAPWFKFFPTDWREGTRHLSAEVRGIYADCLALMYETDAPLPADDKWMAHQLHISVRAWRNALSVLARDGKLFPLQDGWSNSRADEERLKRRSIADQNRIIAQSREDQKREKSKNGSENNETAPRTVPREEHHVHARQTSDSRESEGDGGSAREIDPHELYEKLTEAANGSLYPLAIGLHAVAEPLMWIRQGADLELDILPVIRDIGHKAEPQSISTWSYFARPVARQKKRREAGLPDVPEPAAQARAAAVRRPQFEDWREKRQREQREFLDLVRSMS
jgi:uncharacterized protein YdaU (DUF1376 family)